MMVNNADIQLCNVSHKSRWNNSHVCANDVLGCSCSDYYLNCADVCELLFIKVVILPGQVAGLQTASYSIILSSRYTVTICMQAWPHALQGYDRIVSRCLQLTQIILLKMRPYSYDVASGSLQEKPMTRMNGGLLIDMHCHVTTTDWHS